MKRTYLYTFALLFFFALTTPSYAKVAGQGDPLTLNYSSSNANGCNQIGAPPGYPSMTPAANSSGAYSLTAGNSGTFTLTCSGSGGSASASDNLTVIVPPSNYSASCSNGVITVSGTPTGPAGSTYPLRVDDTIDAWNPGSCNGYNGNDYCIDTLSSFPQSVNGTTGHSYNIWSQTLYSGIWSPAVSTSVTCSGTPPTATISQSTSQTNSGDSFTLSWGSTSATSCTVTYSGPTTPGTISSGPTSGTATLSPQNVGTYTATNSCSGPGGSTSASLTHTVVCPSGTSWNGSSCVANTATSTSCGTYNYQETNASAIATYCGACPAGYSEPSSLSCTTGAPGTWSNWGNSCTGATCSGCGCTQTPTTCTDPSANNYGGTAPCTYTTSTCWDPTADNYGSTGPCTYPTTCTDPSASNYGGSLPCGYWGSCSGYQDVVATGTTGGAVARGTDSYTSNSNVGKAAVHYGILAVGESATIRETFTGVQTTFTGSLRNGVRTQNYNSNWCAMTLAKVPTVVPTLNGMSIAATPRTVNNNRSATLTWMVTNPISSCSLKAQVVCTGGHASCSAAQLSDESRINSILTTGTTDSSDPYGPNRNVQTAVQTVAPLNNPTGTKALGTKTILMNYSTDFNLNCGTSTQKKVRVVVSNENEG